VSRLANSIVVLRNGRVAALGDPAEVLSRTELVPQDAVEEAGAVIEAQISQHDVQFGLTMLQSEAGLLRAPQLDLPIGTIVRVRIRARDVMIANTRPVGLSALNVLPGKVIELRKSGETEVEVSIDCNGVKLGARLTRKSVESLGLKSELPVYAILKSVALDRSTLGKSPLSANLRGADLGVQVQDENAQGGASTRSEREAT
jgi:molybdate transport system ATP-binding protein